MKTIRMKRTLDVRPTESTWLTYYEGETYERVPEAHVEKIVEAKAGEVVEDAGKRQRKRST